MSQEMNGMILISRQELPSHRRSTPPASMRDMRGWCLAERARSWCEVCKVPSSASVTMRLQFGQVHSCALFAHSPRFGIRLLGRQSNHMPMKLVRCVTRSKRFDR